MINKSMDIGPMPQWWENVRDMYVLAYAHDWKIWAIMGVAIVGTVVVCRLFGVSLFTECK